MTIPPISNTPVFTPSPAVTNKVAEFMQKNWASILVLSLCVGVLAYTFYSERKKNQIIFDKSSGKKFSNLYSNYSRNDFDDTIKFLKGTNKTASQRFLLTGPRLSGKSHVARAVSNEAQVPIVEIDCDTIISSSVLASRIVNAFDAAKKKKGCVVLVKHVDALKPDDLIMLRGDRIQSRNSVWNKLQEELKKLKSEDRIAAFITTRSAKNSDLDEITFDRELEINHPNEQRCKQILQDLLQGKTVQADLGVWAAKCDGWSYSRIKKLVAKVALSHLTITDSHFQIAFDRCKKDDDKFTQEKLRRISKQGPGEFLFDVENRFDQIAGAEEAKEKMLEITDYLKSPTKSDHVLKDPKKDHGILDPKGVILHGPPGTGKTALAGALAGEVDCPFLYLNGASLTSKWVGESANQMRKLFQQAKSIGGPCVIFVDEIDSWGKRTDGMGGQEAVAKEIINTFLSETDGLKTHRYPIVVIGATNRMGSLDNAFRAGRFDRKIKVSLPNKDHREQILKIHSDKFKADSNIDFAHWAECTPNTSGADLKELMKDAARLAVKPGSITSEHIEEAYYARLLGAKITLKRDPEDIKRTAIHEVGHALAAYRNGLKVFGLSIRPRGDAWGVTLSAPNEGKSQGKQDLERHLQLILGGQAAEELMYEGDHSTGCSSDREKANDMIHEMVYVHGYGKGTQAPYSDKFPDALKKKYAEKVETIFTDQLQAAKNKLRGRVDTNLLNRISKVAIANLTYTCLTYTCLTYTLQVAKNKLYGSAEKVDDDTKLLNDISTVLMKTETLMRRQFEFLALFLDGKVEEALEHEDIIYSDKAKMLEALKETKLITKACYDEHLAAIRPQAKPDDEQT